MKKKIEKVKYNKILLLLFLVGLVLLFVQYLQYLQLETHIGRLITVSSKEIAVTNSFFKINQNEFAGSKADFLQQYEISSNVGEITLGYLNMNSILKKSFTKEVLSQYLDNNPEYAATYGYITYEKYISEIPNITDPADMLAIYFNDKIPPNTEVSIIIASKTVNVWNYILGRPKYETGFKTIADVINQKNKTLGDSLVDHLITYVAHKEFVKSTKIGQEEQSAACPLWSSNAKYLQDSYSNPLFKVGSVRCSYFDQFLPSGVGDRMSFTGELVIVDIFTPNIEDGKKAFLTALAQDGFKPSDKLRVEYIHKPR